jgi:hypothetical protein
MFSPIIKKWGLYFSSETCDYDTRDDIAKEFRNFCFNANIKEFKPKSDCYIGGKIFGDTDFPNGNTGLTEAIASIERAGQDIVGGKAFKVTTVSGKEYYFLSGDVNDKTNQMLKDVRLYKMPHQHWHYNERDFYRDDLL